MRTLIKNGTIVTAAESYPADLLLADGRIALMGQDLPAESAQVVDARGKYILPGAIDVHTHMELPFGGTVASDDFYSGPKAAAFGGTTTHLDFVIQDRGESLHQAVERWHKRSDPKAAIDYGNHMAITDLTPAVMDEIPSMAAEGITTLKLFVAIPGKELGKERFDQIPNGVPGIEDRMPILWTYGVGQGHFSLNRLVEIGCTNPAKIFGLYPRKGTLAVGADADVVIWDPQVVKTIGAKTSHQRTDYNHYEGWQVRGLPEKVYLRGNLLVDGDTWNGEPGGGSWLKRSPHAPLL